MQELEKILQEIDCRFENLLITDDECRKTALSKHDYEKVKYYRTGIVFTERAMDIVKDIIIKHMSGKDIDVLANDGWVPLRSGTGAGIAVAGAGSELCDGAGMALYGESVAGGVLRVGASD